MAQVDSLARMKALFVPGPVLLFAVGWINTGTNEFPIWLLVPALLISVPCSLAFFVAGMKVRKDVKVDEHEGGG